MKFEDVFSFEHLYTKAKKCCNGVRWKASTQNFEKNLLLNVIKTKKQLFENKFKSKGFRCFTIRERGKTRQIQAVHISERLVQKCLCDYCIVPAFRNSLIYDNGATLKDKGLKFTLKRLKTHIHRYFIENKTNKGYILKFDLHNYFGSINHKKILQIAQKYIKDKKLFELYKYFINCFNGNFGIGLGSQISQISALIYLNSLDHYIKDICKFKYYGRYMDDGYIICNDKKKLKELLFEIKGILKSLDLRLNENKTQIMRLEKGFTILKRRFILYSNGKLVVRTHKDNILRYKKQIRKMLKKNIDTKNREKCFKGYLKEFNYIDRYTRRLLCIK